MTYILNDTIKQIELIDIFRTLPTPKKPEYAIFQVHMQHSLGLTTYWGTRLSQKIKGYRNYFKLLLRPQWHETRKSITVKEMRKNADYMETKKPVTKNTNGKWGNQKRNLKIPKDKRQW